MKPQSAKAKKYRWAKSPEDYLLQRIRKGNCWIWTAGVDKDGYGQCQSSKYGEALKVSRAHQLAYVTWKGEYDRNLWILHKCNNPPCCNPSHLYAGTALENNRDMTDAGRQYYPRGLDAVNTKLRPEQVREIRSLKGKKTCHELAARFKVSFGHICRLWRGERYVEA